MVQTHDDPLAAEELQESSEAGMGLPPLCDPVIHQWATHEGTVHSSPGPSAAGHPWRLLHGRAGGQM